MAASRRRLRCLRSWMFSLLIYCVYSHLEGVLADDVESCEHLRLGQYLCKDPKIDEATQEPENCRDTTAWGESGRTHVFRRNIRDTAVKVPTPGRAPVQVKVQQNSGYSTQHNILRVSEVKGQTVSTDEAV
uniref:Uncharacterized protein n=1 Tax=Stegastes partitus TaxID=144197 RepID=A0A3B5A2L4_9TELE